ncbi:MAG: helix-turn-helix domain-containing protein, partial [Candidatus Omnitrophota bacterium]|nr:helix-turn-helix domain-containing protein [Candidatus Omnitrophota bacterium]
MKKIVDGFLSIPKKSPRTGIDINKLRDELEAILFSCWGEYSLLACFIIETIAANYPKEDIAGTLTLLHRKIGGRNVVVAEAIERVLGCAPAPQFEDPPPVEPMSARRASFSRLAENPRAAKAPPVKPRVPEAPQGASAEETRPLVSPLQRVGTEIMIALTDGRDSTPRVNFVLIMLRKMLRAGTFNADVARESKAVFREALAMAEDVPDEKIRAASIESLQQALAELSRMEKALASHESQRIITGLEVKREPDSPFACGLGVYNSEGEMDEEAKRLTIEVLGKAKEEGRLFKFDELPQVIRQEIQSDKDLTDLFSRHKNIYLLLHSLNPTVRGPPYIWHKHKRRFLVGAALISDNPVTKEPACIISYELIRQFLYNDDPEVKGLASSVITHEEEDLAHGREDVTTAQRFATLVREHYAVRLEISKSSAPQEVAIIGWGSWGKVLCENLLERFPDLTLHIAARSNYDEVSRQYAGMQNVRVLRAGDIEASIFENPAITAVFIATQPGQHYELAKEALLAGKDVFVEKPFTLNLAEAKDLARIAERKERILAVGYELMHEANVGLLAGYIREGRFGRVTEVNMSLLNPLGEGRQLTDSPNSLEDIGVHLLSILQVMFGVKKVTGLEVKTPDIKREALISFSYGGIRVTIRIDRQAPQKERKIEVSGSETFAALDLLSGRFNDPAFRGAEFSMPPVRRELEDFFSACASRSPPRASAKSTLWICKVTERVKAELSVVPPLKKAAVIFGGGGLSFEGVKILRADSRILGDIKPVQKMLRQAKKIFPKDLGAFLMDSNWEDDRDELWKSTAYSGPGIMLRNLISFEYLRHSCGGKFEPQAAVGNSYGHIAALITAGVLSFKDGLKLAQELGRQMELVPDREKAPQIMLVVDNLARQKIESAISELGMGEQVFISNSLTPVSFVVSGYKEAVLKFKEFIESGDGREVKFKALELSVAYHSPRCQKVSDGIRGWIDAGNITIRPPAQIAVYGNTTGTQMYTAEEVKEDLIRWPCSEIMWERTTESLLTEGINAVIEFHPLAVLSKHLARTHKGEVDNGSLFIDSLSGPKSLHTNTQELLGRMRSAGIILSILLVVLVGIGVLLALIAGLPAHPATAEPVAMAALPFAAFPALGACGWNLQFAQECPWQEMVRSFKDQPAPSDKNQENYQENNIALRKCLLEKLALVTDWNLETFVSMLKELHIILLLGEDKDSIYIPAHCRNEEECVLRASIFNFSQKQDEFEKHVLPKLRVLFAVWKRFLNLHPCPENILALIRIAYEFHFQFACHAYYLFNFGNNSLAMNIVNAMLRLHSLKGIEHDARLDEGDYWIHRRELELFVNLVKQANPNLDMQVCTGLGPEGEPAPASVGVTLPGKIFSILLCVGIIALAAGAFWLGASVFSHQLSGVFAALPFGLFPALGMCALGSSPKKGLLRAHKPSKGPRIMVPNVKGGPDVTIKYDIAPPVDGYVIVSAKTGIMKKNKFIKVGEIRFKITPSREIEIGDYFPRGALRETRLRKYGDRGISQTCLYWLSMFAIANNISKIRIENTNIYNLHVFRKYFAKTITINGIPYGTDTAGLFDEKRAGVLMIVNFETGENIDFISLRYVGNGGAQGERYRVSTSVMKVLEKDDIVFIKKCFIIPEKGFSIPMPKGAVLNTDVENKVSFSGAPKIPADISRKAQKFEIPAEDVKKVTAFLEGAGEDDEAGDMLQNLGGDRVKQIEEDAVEGETEIATEDTGKAPAGRPYGVGPYGILDPAREAMEKGKYTKAILEVERVLSAGNLHQDETLQEAEKIREEALKSLKTPAERIRALQESKGWSQEKCAEQCGLSRKGFFLIVKGGKRRKISDASLRKIADVFSIPKNLLVYKEEALREKRWQQAIKRAASAKTLGEKVRILRHARGIYEDGRPWSEETLHKKAGISASRISHIENSRSASEMLPDTIRKLANVLKVSPDFLAPPLNLREREKEWQQALKRAASAKTLGEKVRILRHARGVYEDGKPWSQETLSKKSTVQRRTIQDIEKNRGAHEEDTIRKLANVLKVSPDFLAPPLNLREREKEWQQALKRAAKAKTLGEKVRILRHARGMYEDGKPWTQETLHGKTRIPTGSISEIENNRLRRKISHKTIIRLANVLKVSPDFLAPPLNLREREKEWQEALKCAASANTLGAKVRILRHARGMYEDGKPWTQKILQGKAGISASHISYIENNHPNAGILPDTIRKLTNALKVKPDFLAPPLNLREREEQWQKALKEAENAGTIGEQLVILRIARGIYEDGKPWSFAKLAGKTGFGRWRLWRLEHNTVNSPDPELLNKLRQVLHVVSRADILRIQSKTERAQRMSDVEPAAALDDLTVNGKQLLIEQTISELSGRDGARAKVLRLADRDRETVRRVVAAMFKDGRLTCVMRENPADLETLCRELGLWQIIDAITQADKKPFGIRGGVSFGGAADFAIVDDRGRQVRGKLARVMAEEAKKRGGAQSKDGKAVRPNIPVLMELTAAAGRTRFTSAALGVLAAIVFLSLILLVSPDVFISTAAGPVAALAMPFTFPSALGLSAGALVAGMCVGSIPTGASPKNITQSSGSWLYHFTVLAYLPDLIRSGSFTAASNLPFRIEERVRKVLRKRGLSQDEIDLII